MRMSGIADIGPKGWPQFNQICQHSSEIHKIDDTQQEYISLGKAYSPTSPHESRSLDAAPHTQQQSRPPACRTRPDEPAGNSATTPPQ